MDRSAPDGLMVRFSSSHPDRITALVASGFFRAGNTALVNDPTRPVQLRPYTPEEERYIDWSDPADNALLVHRNHGQVLSVHFVTVAPSRMANTPENVEAAIADLAEHEPMHALVLRRAAAKAAETGRDTKMAPNADAALFAAPRSRRGRRREQRRAESQKGGPRQARPSA